MMIWLMSAAALLVLRAAKLPVGKVVPQFFRNSRLWRMAGIGDRLQVFFLGLHPEIAGRDAPELGHWVVVSESA